MSPIGRLISPTAFSISRNYPYFSMVIFLLPATPCPDERAATAENSAVRGVLISSFCCAALRVAASTNGIQKPEGMQNQLSRTRLFNILILRLNFVTKERLNPRHTDHDSGTAPA